MAFLGGIRARIPNNISELVSVVIDALQRARLHRRRNSRGRMERHNLNQQPAVRRCSRFGKLPSQPPSADSFAAKRLASSFSVSKLQLQLQLQPTSLHLHTKSGQTSNY